MMFSACNTVLILTGVVDTLFAGPWNNFDDSGGAIPIRSDFQRHIAWLKFPDIVAALVRDKFDMFVIVCLLPIFLLLHLLLDLFDRLHLL